MSDKHLAPDQLKQGGNLPEQWKRFIRNFNIYITATNRDTASQKVRVALLLRTIGDYGNDIYESFVWENAADKEDFTKVVDKFSSFCKPRINVVAMTHKLLTCKQGSQPFDDYLTQLHAIARDCNFEKLYDRMILQAILLGIESERTRRKLFETVELSLDQALKVCRADEAACADLKALQTQSQDSVNAVRAYSASSKKQQRQKKTRNGQHCGNCGKNHPPRKCPAYGKTCDKCKKRNHFASECRSTRKTDSGNLVLENDNFSDEELFALSVKKSPCGRKWFTDIPVTSQDGVNHTVTFQLDLGATSNVLSFADYEKLGSPKMTKASSSIEVYNDSTMKPLGVCMLSTTVNQQSRNLRCLVVHTKHYSLLSGTNCVDFGLVTIQDNVYMIQDTLDSTLQQFNDVFTNLGTLPGEYEMDLDSTVRPVQVRPRKIPLSMKTEVQQKLDELEHRGIIAKVDYPTEWISHVQPVRKANGQIRLCIDPRNLNLALKRNHFEMPSIEDVLPELSGAKYFSLCDARDGFLQVKLSAKSSDYTTFWGPTARYKWLRMPFGISTAPEEFQRRLTQALHGLTGVKVVADDILIYGHTRNDHDNNLKQLLARARETGLTLNRDKCVFLKTELSYIGHLLTSDGVKPDPNKASAIRNMPPPADVDQLRQFLGHVTYMGKFIPNLSAESEPLRRLLSSDSEFVWGPDQKRAYDKLVQEISEEKVLQYYNPAQPVIIQTDASTAGLGAVLIQNGRPVAYTSRSLSDAETRYAPLELECLAIVFATRKFDQFIFGHPDVTIQTDHKPLISIFNRSLLLAPRRLQSMLLTLQRYSFKVEWRPGTQQITADMLSRNPLQVPSVEILTDHVFTFIDKSSLRHDAPFVDPVIEKIRTHTKKDSELQNLKRHILADWSFCDDEMKPYWSFRAELTIDTGLLVKGNRVIIPKSLRANMLSILHASHQGLAATLRRARRSVYWPNVNTDVRRAVENCRVCQLDAPNNRTDELLSHNVPDQPWMKVGVDLFAHGGNNYLVIVDFHSDFYEFSKVTDLTADSTICELKKSFARWGVPIVVQSDNGPQFTSREFARFSEVWSFIHTTSAPYHHRSNGKAESAVKLAKKILKRSDDPQLALLEYRNTPTQGMETSPVERLIGRQTRTPLPEKINYGAKSQHNRSEKEYRRRQVVKSYNRSAVPLKEIKEGDPVLVKDVQALRGGWKDARIHKQLTKRSYLVDMGNELLRRDRHFLRPMPRAQTDTVEPIATDTVEPTVEPTVSVEPVYPEHTVTPQPVRTTRSGRVSRPPAYLKDFTT